MFSKLVFKNTVLFLLLLMVYCGNSSSKQEETHKIKETTSKKIFEEIKTGAENYTAYIPLLKNKKIGIVTNQTGIIISKKIIAIKNNTKTKSNKGIKIDTISIVDFLLKENVTIQKIFAPEHGFRGTSDAGENIKDEKDPKTGLSIISLYGANKKPKKEQLSGIDLMVFDIQDVGVRFYTYLSTLHYVMESCSENNIPLIILDRPNPNISIIDGPVLEKEYKSFVGLHPVPVLYGMTIGEYGKMINGEKWLNKELKCKLTVIPCLNYHRNSSYNLPIKPSPNLPNDHAINLYASLCLFEGTNVSVGRGTNKQFQVYGSPYLPRTNYKFIPKPNIGAQNPIYNNTECFGEDLTQIKKVKHLELKWLIKAYQNTSDKSKFFNAFFTKLAGTKKLQQQIENKLPEDIIRKSWQKDLDNFKKIRAKYLIYQ